MEKEKNAAKRKAVSVDLLDSDSDQAFLAYISDQQFRPLVFLVLLFFFRSR